VAEGEKGATRSIAMRILNSTVEGRALDDKDHRSQRQIEPPPNLDPKLARFIEELARAAVRREAADNRLGARAGDA
jgi:hypothetical protein